MFKKITIYSKATPRQDGEQARARRRIIISIEKAE
jgi:hypothetical protein